MTRPGSLKSFSTVLAANITVNNKLEDSARPESASSGNDDGQEMKSPAVDTKRPKPQAVEHEPEPESEWVKPCKRRRKPSRRMHLVIEPASSPHGQLCGVQRIKKGSSSLEAWTQTVRRKT